MNKTDGRTKNPMCGKAAVLAMACAMAFAAATQVTKKEKKVHESVYASGAGLMFV